MLTKKALVVDDSATDRENLQAVLEDLNISVITAASGQDAIKHAANERPDIIFLDILMSGMDGYTVCRELQSDDKTNSIPVVFVSSKGNKADMVWADEQGGAGYVVKPYAAQEIKQQLERLA